MLIQICGNAAVFMKYKDNFNLPECQILFDIYGNIATFMK